MTAHDSTDSLSDSAHKVPYFAAIWSGNWFPKEPKSAEDSIGILRKALLCEIIEEATFFGAAIVKEVVPSAESDQQHNGY
jgi:hypothetical protein